MNKLFMQKELRQAYKNKTRSYDGKPGKNYFVNRTDYKINAEFNPKTRLLSGTETMTYTNNSADTLKQMYFNLYQDIFKKGNARDWDIGAVDITDGVKIKKIVFNGKLIKVNSDAVSNRQSILRIKLPENINPETSAKIEISWEFTFPGTVPIRMGTYEKDNFMIAYWYPKVTVYDDIVGWNTHGHTGNQEFYNDFGNFDVSITVPGDYQLWATGILQNITSLYTDKYIKRFEKSEKTDDVVHIISAEDRKSGDIMKKSEKIRISYMEIQIGTNPGFCFCNEPNVLLGCNKYSIRQAKSFNKCRLQTDF
ncbi:MAG: M1 family metallopeptidase [Chlorobi bacterium]|nr:M1 family metallopeptidase [Chlorobiota bacterium]